jgi:NADH/NAD ratio-sensing transcriptional regulator Rex
MADAPATTPAWNSNEAIRSAVAQYKAQFDQAVQAIQNIDQQRVNLVKTTDTLVGAIAALEQLLKNQQDEVAALAVAEATKAPEEPAAPVVAEPPQG